MSTKRWKFGAKKPRLGLEFFNEQLYLSNKYQNNLVSLYKDCSDQFLKAREEYSEDLKDVQSKIDGYSDLIEAEYVKLRQNNQKNKLKTVDPEIKANIAALKKERKVFYEEKKRINLQLKSDPKMADISKSIQEDRIAKQKELRENCGLSWGTYLIIEKRIDAAFKKKSFNYKRYDGSGTVAIQIQKPAILQVKNTQDGFFTFVMSRKNTGPVKEENNGVIKVSREKKMRHDGKEVDVSILHLYMPDPKSRGKKILISLPVKFHRLIPNDAHITWIEILRKKIGTRTLYEVQFSLQREKWEEKPIATNGVIGVDYGYRYIKDQGLRVAVGGCSQDKSTLEIIIPNKKLRKHKHVDELQGLRQNKYNPVLETFKMWIKKPNIILPEWLIERTKNIPHWKGQSQSKLAKILIYWRHNRIDGDNEMFEFLEAWRKQDKHLYDWQESERQMYLRWRDDFYRNHALDLRKKYSVVKRENLNWATLQKNKAPDELDPVNKENRNAAAVGRLGEISDEVCNTIRVSAVNSSKTCHLCKKTCKLDGKDQMHTCEHCGATWDRDHNAAWNLCDNE